MNAQTRKGVRARVAVIGGGIFGVTTALKLAPACDVDLFERSAELFRGATFANHGRQHFGFHYPRSLETARQCLESREDFRSLYGAAEVTDFPNYYAVAAGQSKVTPEQYLEFCDAAGLAYEKKTPPDGVIAAAKVALSIEVKEGVLDVDTLKELALNRIKSESSIRVRTGHEIKGGSMLGDGRKELIASNANGKSCDAFDFVISATYAYSNAFCEWFGFPLRQFQYNLQELSIIELPDKLRLGITIMDGAFPSVIPMGRTGYHLLAHVNASQLARESSRSSTPLLGRMSSVESNWEGILNASADYLPMLRRARYIKSLFVDRVVDAGATQTDARLTDIIDHGHGCFSIFAAKIITCVSTAHKLMRMVQAQT